MPTKPELQASAAVNLSAIQTHADRLAKDMLALYALDQPAPPAEPPVVDPPVVVNPPPITESGYGCQVEPLHDWEFRAVKGAGRPASVPVFGSGNVMERFRFHPRAGDLATDKGICSGAEKGVIGVIVRDSIVDGYKPWGGNTKGVYTASFERNTTRGLYGTGQHIEHGRYLGAEGWGDAVADECRATSVTVPSEIMQAIGHGDVAAVYMTGEFFDHCPGGGYQEVNRDFHKGSTEAHRPETFDNDAGATWIHGCKFLNCGMGHPAATISLFASQHSGSGDAMRRANKAAYITETVVEAFALPQHDLKPKASLLMIAGKQAILVEGGAFRRSDMGSTNRSLMSFGDPYAGRYAGWTRAGAPATTDGGPIVCRDFTVWSETPTKVSIDMLPGTPLTWRGVTYESDSAPIRLVINGEEVGDITKEILP